MRESGKVTRVSILNDVLGPVTDGPSSSHTAGSYHIARIVSGLLGAPPRPERAIGATCPMTWSEVAVLSCGGQF